MRKRTLKQRLSRFTDGCGALFLGTVLFPVIVIYISFTLLFDSFIEKQIKNKTKNGKR